jgi:glyoxylase-like metal-dependent hydrolase (beta-lactamase superfamily II)
VPGRKGGRYPYCHSLVLTGEETWVVDPASDQDYLRTLARSRRVTRVFISHFHEDHLKYHHLFPEATFHVPQAEAAAFASLAAVFELMGLTDRRFRDYWGQTLKKEFRFPPLNPLIPYAPGERFQTGGLTLEVVPAAGHTPGHSCFHFPRQGVLYLADVDLTPFGPWYGDLASDLDAFEETLVRLGRIQACTYLTAHEQGVFDYQGFQAGLAYFQAVIRDREERLRAALAVPQSLPQLVARQLIYPKWKEPLFVYEHMEAQMLMKHLARLRKQGAVEETPLGYQAV